MNALQDSPQHNKAARRHLATEKPGANLTLGIGLALFTVVIWVGWFMSTRFVVTRDLGPFDVAALRFGVAGALLAPVVFQRGIPLRQIGWKTLAVLCIGAGAPYVMAIAAGLSLAPAGEGASLTPGVMPLFVAAFSAWLFGERFSASRKTGFVLIFAGVLLIAGLGLLNGWSFASAGHMLFLTGALLWASYTLALRQSGLSPLHATAILSLVSFVLYLPVYFIWLEPRIFTAPVSHVLFAGFYQGFLTSVVSLITYSRAVALLGASRASAFASLIPALTTALSVPLLGEVPGIMDAAGALAITAGVYLATGGRLPRLPFRPRRSIH